MVVLVGAAIMLMSAPFANASVEKFRSSGVVCDNVNFENLTITQDGSQVTVAFDYKITANNRTEINQMLVSANGKVVEFVSEGIVGDGKSGHASVTFSPSDYTSGTCHIEIGICFDYTNAQAKEGYESPKKSGYRIEVGYIYI